MTKGDPGCLKSLAFLAVVIFGSVLVAFIFNGIGEVLFAIPWFVWPILIILGIYIVNKFEGQ